MKLLPLATGWETITHLRGQTKPGPFEYRDPKPRYLQFVISAIGDVTVDLNAPVCYGAIAIGGGEFKERAAIRVLALEVKHPQPLIIREWLIEQAWKASQALGYYMMFREGRNTLLRGGEPSLPNLFEGIPTLALEESMIDV